MEFKDHTFLSPEDYPHWDHIPQFKDQEEHEEYLQRQFGLEPVSELDDLLAKPYYIHLRTLRTPPGHSRFDRSIGDLNCLLLGIDSFCADPTAELRIHLVNPAPLVPFFKFDTGQIKESLLHLANPKLRNLIPEGTLVKVAICAPDERDAHLVGDYVDIIYQVTQILDHKYITEKFITDMEDFRNDLLLHQEFGVQDTVKMFKDFVNSGRAIGGLEGVTVDHKLVSLFFSFRLRWLQRYLLGPRSLAPEFFLTANLLATSLGYTVPQLMATRHRYVLETAYIAIRVLEDHNSLINICYMTANNTLSRLPIGNANSLGWTHDWQDFQGFTVRELWELSWTEHIAEHFNRLFILSDLFPNFNDYALQRDDILNGVARQILEDEQEQNLDLRDAAMREEAPEEAHHGQEAAQAPGHFILDIDESLPNYSIREEIESEHSVDRQSEIAAPSWTDPASERGEEEHSSMERHHPDDTNQNRMDEEPVYVEPVADETFQPPVPSTVYHRPEPDRVRPELVGQADARQIPVHRAPLEEPPPGRRITAEQTAAQAIADEILEEWIARREDAPEQAVDEPSEEPAEEQQEMVEFEQEEEFEHHPPDRVRNELPEIRGAAVASRDTAPEYLVEPVHDQLHMAEAANSRNRKEKDGARLLRRAAVTAQTRHRNTRRANWLSRPKIPEALLDGTPTTPSEPAMDSTMQRPRRQRLGRREMPEPAENAEVRRYRNREPLPGRARPQVEGEPPPVVVVEPASPPGTRVIARIRRDAPKAEDRPAEPVDVNAEQIVEVVVTSTEEPTEVAEIAPVVRVEVAAEQQKPRAATAARTWKPLTQKELRKLSDRALASRTEDVLARYEALVSNASPELAERPRPQSGKLGKREDAPEEPARPVLREDTQDTLTDLKKHTLRYDMTKRGSKPPSQRVHDLADPSPRHKQTTAQPHEPHNPGQGEARGVLFNDK